MRISSKDSRGEAEACLRGHGGADLCSRKVHLVQEDLCPVEPFLIIAGKRYAEAVCGATLIYNR